MMQGRILGIDPGLNRCGWGIIACEGSHVRFVACGVLQTVSSAPLAERLAGIAAGLEHIIALQKPTEAAMEETFVNSNPRAALALGQARGAAMVAPARAGLAVAEYAPATVKKAVTGVGRAEKEQVQAMVRRLLPTAGHLTPDSADALAVALCHAAHQTFRPKDAA